MRKLRVLLFVPLVLLELLTLLVCWILVFVHRPTAQKLISWGMNAFPDTSWYSWRKN